MTGHPVKIVRGLNYNTLLVSSLCALAIVTAIAFFPGMKFSLYVIVAPTIALPIVIIVYRALRGGLFTILTVYSVIFVWEGLGYLIRVGILDSSLAVAGPLESALIKKTFAILLVAFTLFLVGYSVIRKIIPVRPHNHTTRSRIPYRPAYYGLAPGKWNYLFLMIALTTALSFVKILVRIRAAGGLDSYLETMYLYRFGTFAENIFENSWVVLAINVGGISLALVAIALAVRLRTQARGFYWHVTLVFLGLVIANAVVSSFRSTVLFTIVAVIAVYHSARPIRTGRMIAVILAISLLLVGVNYAHHYLYYSTAGWNYQGLAASSERLITPHNHVESLSQVVYASEQKSYLKGTTIAESVLFFVPRFLWTTKASEYGTLVVQRWAGLPASYQIAVTNAGELIAHFGYWGILGMVLYGMLHGYLETFRSQNIPLMAGYYCIVLPRVLTHIGMGIGAVSITLFQLLILYLITKQLRISASVAARIKSRVSSKESLPLVVEKRKASP